MARILAFDYGKRRIGLAISDPTGVVAQGLDTFERTRVREDLEKLAEIARAREVGLLLFGDPRNMDGTLGAASEGVRVFAGRLGRLSGLPVEFWDERLTTVEANEVLAAEGVPFEKRRKLVDRVAAVILLRSYLEARGT